MQPLKDYSHIRGVCHNPHTEDAHEQLVTEMGYCQRLQLNALRYWMRMDVWEQQGDRYFGPGDGRDVGEIGLHALDGRHTMQCAEDRIGEMQRGIGAEMVFSACARASIPAISGLPRNRSRRETPSFRACCAL